jgi:2'-5' RNA ligase
MKRLPFDNRKYTPHVTLARLKRPDESKIADFMQAHNLFATGAFEASCFNLYHSHQTRNGVAYEVLRSYALRPSRTFPE